MFLVLLGGGFIFLYIGAELLVKSSSAIAVQHGVKKIVVGLTIVAMGTSLPEFVVSLVAALDRVDDVSIGNIVGSNIANILLILGLSALIHPIKIRRRIVILEMPVLIIITLLFIVFCWDQRLTPLEAGGQLVLFLIYMAYIISNRKIQKELELEQDLTPESKPLWVNIVLIILGLAGLILGGRLTVRGAVELARLLNISEVVIGLTVVAIGTSLPELFTSIVAALRGEDEISIGNIIGSNLFNIAFILGIVPLISPLRVAYSIVRFDNWLMLAATLLLGLFTLVSYRDKNIMYLRRWMALIFVGTYIFFILNLVFRIV